MFGALALMVPHKVFAASDGGNVGVSIGGWHADRTPFIWVDFSCAAWGGRPWADGLDGNSHIFANMASQSIEMTEAEQPFQILRYELIEDSAGPGKFRGGASFRRDFRFLEEEGVLQVRSDRRRFRPFGLYGGGPGRASMNYLDPDGENRILPSKFTMTIRRGEVFREEVAGAGGWGDPLERNPERVLRDVRNGFVSRAAAEREYGVVLAHDGWAVEVAATATLRRKLRVARNWETVPPTSRDPSYGAIAAD
jgi:N-methylhydantoinase B